MDYLEDETSLWKVFYYTAYDHSYKKQKKFIDFIEKIQEIEIMIKKNIIEFMQVKILILEVN